MPSILPATKPQSGPHSRRKHTTRLAAPAPPSQKSAAARRRRTPPASRDMKTKMKSNELNSIWARSELVPALSEKMTDPQPARYHRTSLPQLHSFARGGRGPRLSRGVEDRSRASSFRDITG